MDKILEKYNQLEELSEKLSELRVIDIAHGKFVQKFCANYNFTEYGISYANSDSEDLEWLINDFINSKSNTWEEFNLYIYDEIINIYTDCLDCVVEMQNSEEYLNTLMAKLLLEKLQKHYETIETATKETLETILLLMFENELFISDITNVIFDHADKMTGWNKQNELT